MNVPHARSRTIRRHVLATAVACCFSPLLASANPVGPVVTAGQASFNTQGKLLTVTNSPGAIINWQGFSIGAGETTRFVQQSAASAVLNRVVGGQSSSILGALQSNGRVFLINPNGIIFGAGAQIDTAGLIASTLNIMDADFLTGKLRFGQTPDAKSITNAGEIRTPAGGRVMLIAPEGVTNTGIIHAPNGEVILAAGKTVELTDSANPEVRVEVAAPETKAMNLGRIVAESGKVGIYGGLVVNHGVVNANSAAVGENGKIVFRATKDATLEAGSVTTANGASGGSVEVSSGGTTLVAGDVQAKGSAGSGGEVKILGERVGLAGNASVDASGQSGGGTVLVGGDLQGANAAIQNAKQTYVGADTRIAADALTAGDGGKVIVWADDTTRSYGSISARGGQLAGNGGFVETSGKGGLDVRSGPDVRAPAGRPGTWLLDPVDLEVVAGGIFDSTINSGAPFFAPLTESSRIGVDLINAQLNFGSNVILTTTSRGTSAGAQQGNITISAPIVKAASSQPGGPFIGTTSLTLQAHNDIIITPAGSITSTGDALNVVLTANADNSGGGGITVGGAITTRGGSFTATGADAISINAPISTINAAGTFGNSVQINSTTGAVNVAGAVSSGFFSANGQGGVTISAPITATSSISASSNNGTTTIASNLSSTGSVTLSGRNGVWVASGTQITTGQFNSFGATVSDPGSTGVLSIESGSQITTASAGLTSDNMDIQGVVNAGNGSITVLQNNSGRAITVGAEVAGTLSLSQLELNNLVTTGTLSVGNNNSGAMTFAGPITSTMPTASAFTSGNSITQNAGLMASGSLFYNAPTITIAAPVSSSAVNSVTLTANNLAVNSTVTSGGNIDVSTRTSSRPIALGVGSPTGTALELTAAQINNLVAPGRLKFSTGGAISIAGAIAPSGTNTLSLASSSNAITQAAGAAVTVQNLALSANGTIAMQQDNDVTTLAAQTVCCSAGNIDFVSKPGKLVNIGIVDGVNGVRTNNFSGASNIAIQADDLNITSPVFVNSGNIKLKTRDSSTTVTLGADAGGTLGLTAAELAQVQGSTLTIAGDRMDIAGPVAFFPGTTTLAPATANRPVSIVSSKSFPGELQFLPGEFANLTGSTVIVGGPSAGPIAVNAAFSAPASVSNFVLQSADPTNGITVAAAANIGATNTIGLVTDVLDLGAGLGSTNGSVNISTHTAARNIHLGTDPGGSLGLSTTELGLITAPNGTVAFTSPAGNIDVSGSVSYAGGSIGALALDAGNTLTVSANTSVPGTLSMRAPNIVIGSTIAAGTGINLAGNSINIGSMVTTSAGDLNVTPRDFRNIDLGGADSGSNLGLTSAELGNLRAPNGVLRIGDTNGNTGDIHVSSAISLPFDSALSLKTGDGSVTQAVGATITVPDATFTNGRLAIEADGSITLNAANVVNKVALTSYNGPISFVRATGGPLSVVNIDNVVGINAGFGNQPVSLTADQINLTSTIQGDSVGLFPTAMGAINLGTKSGFSFTQSELDNIYAYSTLTIGNASSGDISVSQPVTVNNSGDLALVTGPSKTVTVAPGATVDVPWGNLSITGGTLNTGAAMTSGGAANLIADSITLGGTVTSSAGTINIRPLTAGALIDIGGADAPAPTSPPGPPTLGLDATDLGNLSYSNGTLTIGSTSAGNITVNHAGTLPDSVTLVTGGDVTINASKFAAANNLGITANNVYIPSAGDVNGIAIEAGGNIFISPATISRSIVLGSDPDSGTDLFLTDADLAKIKITGTAGTLSFDTGGTLTTTSDLLPFTLVPNVSLSATTLDLSGAPLSAAGNITLRGDSILSSNFKAVSSTGGGRINVTPRTFRSLVLGTTPGGGTVGLLPSQLALLSTSGVVQFGGDATSAINITAPLVQPAGSSALALIASGAISQTAGSSVTASNLRVQSSGAVSLGDTGNTIGTVAGANSGNFTVASTGTLTVGTVDGAAGINAGNVGAVTVLADALNINETIFGNTATLAPRTAGAAIDLGTKGSGFGLADAEIDRVSAFTLNVGTSASPNASGNITVSAAVDRTSGALNLATGAGHSINVNAPLGSSNTSSLSLNSGIGGTANVNGPLHAASNVSVTADTITTSQQITSDAGSINLLNASNNGSITLNGVVDSYFGVQVTGKTITVNAPMSTRYPFGNISLGAASGTTGSSVAINNQITAGSTVTVVTDAIAINAPVVTLNSTITLQPRTAGMPISVGTETSGAFSLSSSELALLDTDFLTIGSTSAGPLAVNAPISSSTLQQLSLQSNGDITQSPTAPIVLSYAITDPQTGFVQPAATLNVVSNSGKVELAAANDINNSVTGRAGGSTQNFVFNNLSPLKLQNVTPELGLAPTGKALLSSPPGTFVPRAPTSLQQQQAIDAALAAILQAGDTQKDADKDADAKKEEGEQKDREERKKEGKKSCS